jgi:transposase
MISFPKRERAQHARACVGVDAGKFSHTLVVRPQGRADSKPFSSATTRAGFESGQAFIRQQAGDAPPETILVGIEFAGYYGFTFAHYLAQRGFPIVSVLPAHTKRWKDVAHNQPLKTDAKDAGTITDLLAQGHFVTFPFLQAAYADLRYLVSARERLSWLRRGALTQLRCLLHVVFPEFEEIFPYFTKKTPLVLLRAYPTPQQLLATTKTRVIRLLKATSRGQLGAKTYERLVLAARSTLGLPGAQARLGEEIALILDRLALFERQMRGLEAQMVEALASVPEAPYLLTVPKVAPLTAAVFLGSIGDPQAYEADEQILKVAGLSLVERSSGILRGTKRISKRGRPLLRAAAYMFAVRSITTDGLFRAEYQALCARNGGQKLKAVVAVMRSGLRLLYSIARDRRRFTVEPPSRHRRLGIPEVHEA